MAVMTCMFARVLGRARIAQWVGCRVKRQATLTLAPLPPAEGYLALDELKDMQLQHGVLNLQYPLQDRLLSPDEVTKTPDLVSMRPDCRRNAARACTREQA